MTLLDPTIPITLFDGSPEEKTGNIKVQRNDGNVIISFFPDQTVMIGNQEQKRVAHIPEKIYQLSDFLKLEIDPNNSLEISLASVNFKITIIFKNENDLSLFLDYISHKIQLEHSSSNTYVFLIKPINEETSTFLIPILPKIPRKDNITLNDLQKYGILFESPISDPPFFSNESFLSLFDTTGKVTDSKGFLHNFFNAEIDPQCMEKVLRMLLYSKYPTFTNEERQQKDDQRRHIYKVVKNQWRTTTKKQWINNPYFQSLVQTLETDIKKHSELFSSFNNPKVVQKIVFNVFLTMSIYDHDNCQYFEGTISYIFPFLTYFIKEVHQEQTITKPSNENITTEEVEADIFNIFIKFYKKNRILELIKLTQKSFLRQLFVRIGNDLKNNFPELLQLLNQKYVFCFDFLIDDCKTWFLSCFKDIIRLWVSSLTFDNCFEFLRCFIISLLMSLVPKLTKMNPLNAEEFLIWYNQMKKELDLNLLLTNTKFINEHY